MSALYLTTAELAAAPTGINWGTVFTGVGQPTNGQTWLCQVVSALVDRICAGETFDTQRPYMLRASTDTETAITTDRMRAMVTADGSLLFRATYRPIINVLSGTWIPVAGAGMTGGPTNAFTLQTVYWEGRDIVLMGLFEAFRMDPIRVSVTYQDGFANALLTGAVVAGATSLPVDEQLGFAAGQQFTIYDMPPETVTVQSSYVAASGPGSVPLTAGLSSAHAIGIRVSALMPDVQQAALFLAQHLVQSKAQMGVAAARQVLGTGAVPLGGTNYWELAKELLRGYILSP